MTAPSMNELNKLARKLLGSEYSVFALYCPRGVACAAAGNRGLSILIRTGDSRTSKIIMRAAILEIGAMAERNKVTQPPDDASTSSGCRGVTLAENKGDYPSPTHSLPASADLPKSIGEQQAGTQAPPTPRALPAAAGLAVGGEP